MSTTMLAGFFSVFGFGLIVAFLGSIKLQLAPRLGADNAQFGRIVAALQWVMVVMAIIGGLVIDVLGHQVAIGMGAVLAAAAVFLMGRVRAVGGVIALCVLLGIGAQFLNLGGNTLLPGLFADPAAGSNLGNAFFGMGALLVSIIIVALFKRMAFDRALGLVALILLFPLFFALGGGFPTVAPSFNPGVVLSLLGNYVTWIAALLLFCYIGLEVSLAAWITSYAAELGADDAQAARTLSIFLVAMMVSRLLFGLQDKVTGIDLTSLGSSVLIGAALVAVVALSVLIRTGSLRTARGWIFLIGFVFGPIFPTTIGVTFQHFAPSTWGTLFGVIFAVGLIGAAVLPVWIGKLATGRTVQAGLGVLRGAAVGLSLVALALSLLPLA